MFSKILASGVIAASLSLLSTASATAQNSEGTYQVRVGAFLDLGGTKLTNSNTLDEGGATTTGKFGAGMSGGLEMLRAGRWTLGIEGDLGVSGGGSQHLNGVRYGTDYFSSLRGRAGFYVRPDWVIYGTGGFAVRGVNVDASQLTNPNPNEPTVRISGSRLLKTQTGGVIGAGTEYHWGGTIFFAEYLHSNLSVADFAVGTRSDFQASTTDPIIYRVKGQVDQFRLGVKFKLGYDGYYDYVRDELRK